jgi:hypothetical protein
VTPLALNELVNGLLLAPAGDGLYPAWMVPPTSDNEPNPPHGYVVSFIRIHERGFTSPVSRFMRGLCHHYGVELHNFAPNAISQAASFVAVCEGFLGILLTPKNGTGEGLTCGPSLVTKYHSATKNLLRGFGKRCLRSAMRHYSAKGLFALYKEVFGIAW